MQTLPSLVLISGALALAAGRADAQPSTPATPAAPGAPAASARTFGVDAVVALPTGDYGDFASLAFGGLARVELPVGVFTVTGRGGAIFHIQENDAAVDLTYVPLFAGIRYPVGAGGLYLAGELGLSIAYASVDTGFGSDSDTQTELGGSLGVGMRLGKLSVQGGLFMPDLDDAVAIGGSVGFDLAAF